MIRVVLPPHLRALARVEGEVTLDIPKGGPVTRGAVLDALEARYPMLRGTIRDHVTERRRPFLRFFACERDLTHDPPDAPLPEAVVSGAEQCGHARRRTDAIHAVDLSGRAGSERGRAAVVLPRIHAAGPRARGHGAVRRRLPARAYLHRDQRPGPP